MKLYIRQDVDGATHKTLVDYLDYEVCISHEWYFLWQHLVHTNAVLKFKVTSHVDLSGLVIVIANSCVYCVHVGM